MSKCLSALAILIPLSAFAGSGHSGGTPDCTEIAIQTVQAVLKSRSDIDQSTDQQFKNYHIGSVTNESYSPARFSIQLFSDDGVLNGFYRIQFEPFNGCLLNLLEFSPVNK